MNPDLFKPYQLEVAGFSDTELAGFGPSFGDLAVLMEGAGDEAVASLVQRLRNSPDDFFRMWMLASIGSASALSAVADHARTHKCSNTSDTFEEVGLEIPENGPAVWRFSRSRLAVFKRASCNVERAQHPVGLPVDAAVASAHNTVAWHYATITTSALDLGIQLPERLHLVGPRQNCEWTMFFGVDEQSRYCFPRAVLREDEGDDFQDMLRDIERAGGDKGELELRAYNADLVYCNGHILITEDVVGSVGGPPIGIYPNPRCPSCQCTMFHVMSVEHHLRDYGDGFRSIYYCEDCCRAACTGTSWN